MTTILCPLNTVILEGGAEDEEAPEEPVLDDDVRRVIVDVHSKAETAKEKEKLERMCKCTLPLCVVLVINDNPYGLMFSLSLYEGIFHRYYLLSMYWIQVWMP